MADMRKRTRKIDKIVSLAASEERRLGEEAGRSRRHLDEQLARLGELNAYRHTYAKKSPSGSSVSAAQWQDYQSFLHRLDGAVQAQQQIVSDCEQTLETHRQRWLAKRRRLESLERVLEKYQQQDRAFEDRLEQKALDELPAAQNAGFGDDNH